MAKFPTLSCSEVREFDRRAMTEYGVPGIVLMENAGRGMAEYLMAQQPAGPITICCGGGNNGGDGWVMARHLELRGFDVRVIAGVSDPGRLSPDARVNFEIVLRSGIPWTPWSSSNSDDTPWELPEERTTSSTEPGVRPAPSAAPSPAAGLARKWLTESAWIVDALLGTGSRGNPRAPLDEVIQAINATSARVLAVDLPSGLDADTGTVGEPTVRADSTCTLVAAKPGLLVPHARAWVGQLVVVDIGAPRALLRSYLPQ